MWWARSRWARDVEGPVPVSNDRVARVRRISQTADDDTVHLDGEAMGRVLDAWDDGGTAEARAKATGLFGSVVLDQYGVAASAEFTDMRTLDIGWQAKETAEISAG